LPVRHFSLCGAEPDRPRRLLAVSVGAHESVRAGPAAVSPSDPGGGRTRSLAALGNHRHPGDAPAPALNPVFEATSRSCPLLPVQLNYAPSAADPPTAA